LNLYKTKNFTSEIVDVDLKSGIVTGYFAGFGNVDSGGDMIVKGALKKTILERGPEGKNAILHLLQHDTEKVLGKPSLLQEKTKGLYFESKVITTSFGLDTLKLYAADVYNEHSIGYQVINYKKILKENGEIDFYKLLELKLYEGSTVAFGMNSETPFLGLKGLTQEDTITNINNRMDKLIKGLKVGDLTDETYINFEIQLKQIQRVYNDLITLKEPLQNTPEPFDSVKYMLNNLNFIG